MKYFLLFLVGFGLNTGFGQCTVQGFVSQDTIGCNDCVTLNANGFGENTAFIETFNSGQPTGWQFTSPLTIGSTTCGVPSLDGSPFMWMGSNAPAPRSLATMGLDVSAGGTICFEMRYSIQEDPSPCEGPDIPDEGVTLQYSVDNGLSWITINYWPPLNGGYASSMTVWDQYCENIPIAAQTTNTMFRWIQFEVTNDQYDHWGMDNVEITRVSPDYNMTWLHDGFSYGQGNYSGDNPTQACPEGDTLFVIEMTDGTKFCYDTVQVTIGYPTINNIDVLYCGGINGEIEVIATGSNLEYSIDGITYTISPEFVGLGPGNYTIHVSDGECHDSISVEIIEPDPVPNPVINTNDSICSLDTLFISTTEVLNAIYFWEGPDGFSSGTANNIIPNLSSNNSGEYSIYLEVDGCSSDTIVVTIHVSESYDIQLSETICSNETITFGSSNLNETGFYFQNLQTVMGCDSIVTLDLTVIPADMQIHFIAINQTFIAPPFTVQFTNQTPNLSNYDFEWDFGDGTIIQTNNFNVFHEYLANGLYTVSLTATDVITGCVDSLVETDFISTSGLSGLTELTSSKTLIQILDLMGRETTFKPNTPLIYVYDDGSIEKVFSVEY